MKQSTKEVFPLLHLIQLEYKRAQLKTLVFSSMLAILILIFWCVINKSGNPVGYLNYRDAFAEIHFYVSATFSIITAILITKVVLEEYRNKTISILFAYPHPRRRILLAKLIFISMFAFVTTVIASVGIGSALVIQNDYIHAIPEEWTSSMLLEEVLRMLLFATATVGISLVSYYIGMLQKSVPATILTPFIINLIGSGFYYNGSLWSVILISIGWVLVGLILASISLKNIEKADVQ